MNYQSKKRWKRSGVFILVLWAVAASLLCGYYLHALQKYFEKAKSLQKERECYVKELFVAAETLNAGETVTEEVVKRELRYSDEDQGIYMTSEDFGKVLIMDLREGVCLQKSMLVSEGNSLREVLLPNVDTEGYITEGNRVDVRISYGNAEDYVVLSEKLIVSSDEKRGIVLRLTEEELLLLSSAQYDCEAYRDTELYLVKYPDGELMMQSAVNYIPTKEILVMLKRQENASERMELENRMEVVLRR